MRASRIFCDSNFAAGTFPVEDFGSGYSLRYETVMSIDSLTITSKCMGISIAISRDSGLTDPRSEPAGMCEVLLRTKDAVEPEIWGRTVHRTCRYLTNLHKIPSEHRKGLWISRKEFPKIFPSSSCSHRKRDIFFSTRGFEFCEVADLTPTTQDHESFGSLRIRGPCEENVTLIGLPTSVRCAFIFGNQENSMSSMREFENKIASDTVYRVVELQEFLELSAEEIEAIHNVSHRLTPKLQDVVDRMYDLFTQQDATLRHFARPQAGYDGPIPERLEEITPDHPYMKQRKVATLRFLVGLVSRPFNTSAIQHLDWIGKLHNSQAGSRDFKLPAVQFEAGMGFISASLISAVKTLNLPRSQESLVLSGLQKMCWILNDVLLNRLADPPVADVRPNDHRRNLRVESD